MLKEKLRRRKLGFDEESDDEWIGGPTGAGGTRKNKKIHPAIQDLEERIRERVTNLDQEMEVFIANQRKNKLRKSLKSQMRMRMVEMINVKKEEIIKKRE